MQTFLPYPDFAKSAQSLDRMRLGKQRVETLQILTALIDGKGWIHHPATKMWKGCEYQLCLYGIEMAIEWIKRGYQDSTVQKFQDRIKTLHETNLPIWFGNAIFHEAHRSKLMMKMPEHYNFDDTRIGLPYFWPKLIDSKHYSLIEGK